MKTEGTLPYVSNQHYFEYDMTVPTTPNIFAEYKLLYKFLEAMREGIQEVNSLKFA